MKKGKREKGGGYVTSLCEEDKDAEIFTPQGKIRSARLRRGVVSATASERENTSSSTFVHFFFVAVVNNS